MIVKSFHTNILLIVIASLFSLSSSGQDLRALELSVPINIEQPYLENPKLKCDISFAFYRLSVQKNIADRYSKHNFELFLKHFNRTNSIDFKFREDEFLSVQSILSEQITTKLAHQSQIISTDSASTMILLI